MEENILKDDEKKLFFHGGRVVSAMQKILIKMVSF